MDSESRDFKPTENNNDYEDKMAKYMEIIIVARDNDQNELADMLDESVRRLDSFKRNEDKLLKKVGEMDGTVSYLTQQLADVTAVSDYVSSHLRFSVEENLSLKKELDSAHLREQDHQELVDSLRSQTEFLESEMEKVKKEQDDLATELGISGRTKEAFYKERERLKHENTLLKGELGNIQTERDDVGHELGETKTTLVFTHQQLDELKLLNSELTRDKGYMSKEAALQRSLVHQLKKNLILLKTHHDALRKKLDDSNVANSAQKANLFDCQRVNKELRTAINTDQREISNLNRKIYDLSKANYDIKETIKDKEKDVANLKKKVNDAEKKERRSQKALTTLSLRQQKAVKENFVLNQVRRSTTTEITGMKNEKDSMKHLYNKLNRDLLLVSTHLLKTTTLAGEYLKRYEIETKVRRTIELERDKLKHDLHKFFIANLNLNAEKDRCRLDNTLLEQKYEEELLYIRHKEHLIADLKKEMEEQKMEIRKHASLYDEMKAERNVIARSLSETQDMNDELKRHSKILSKQLDQLKEQMTTKDSHLMKVERLNRRKTNEGVKLKWQLAKSRNQLKSCKDTTTNLEKEQMENFRQFEKAKKEQNIVYKNLCKAMNDKAVILTQLDRKSAELSCLQDSVNFMDITLKKGDRQYNQRLDDIKILRLEVLKLRREKGIVVKALENSADLRKEVYHLYAELNRERTKCCALEQEIQTPINFHRWRFLEGTDPDQKDLIHKVGYLQKQLIFTRKELCEKEFELDELKVVYETFKEKVTRMPGFDVYETIANLRCQLNRKEEDVKTLSSVLSSSDLEVQKLRLNDKVNTQQLDEFKKKFYELKNIQDRRKFKEADNDKNGLKCKVTYLPPQPAKIERLNDPSLNLTATLVIPLKCKP